MALTVIGKLQCMYTVIRAPLPYLLNELILLSVPSSGEDDDLVIFNAPLPIPSRSTAQHNKAQGKTAQQVQHSTTQHSRAEQNITIQKTEQHRTENRTEQNRTAKHRTAQRSTADHRRSRGGNSS